MRDYVIIGNRNNFSKIIEARDDIKAIEITKELIDTYAKEFNKKFYQNDYIRLYRISDTCKNLLKRKILIEKINLYAI